MCQQDFIYKNVENQLLRQGFSAGIAQIAASDAVQFWRSSSTFGKGKSVFGEVMKHAKK